MTPPQLPAWWTTPVKTGDLVCLFGPQSIILFNLSK